MAKKGSLAYQKVKMGKAICPYIYTHLQKDETGQGISSNSFAFVLKYPKTHIWLPQTLNHLPEARSVPEVLAARLLLQSHPLTEAWYQLGEQKQPHTTGSVLIVQLLAEHKTPASDSSRARGQLQAPSHTEAIAARSRNTQTAGSFSYFSFFWPSGKPGSLKKIIQAGSTTSPPFSSSFVLLSWNALPKLAQKVYHKNHFYLLQNNIDYEISCCIVKHYDESKTTSPKGLKYHLWDEGTYFGNSSTSVLHSGVFTLNQLLLAA